MTDPRPPRDNIVRAIFPGGELRAGTDGGPPTLTGHFAVFDQWTRIDSIVEGRFMERIAPGAFARTFNAAKPKVLFNHGQDPTMGNQALGIPSVLEEDATGARYEVPLFDGIPPLIMSGLRGNAYGASFRFSVIKDDWNDKPTRSAGNPDGIPERTIREARVPEFGPVTFPAYVNASAGVRSMTDDYTIGRLTGDPERLAEIIAARTGSALPDAGPEAQPHSDEGTREEPPVTAPVVPLVAAAPVIDPTPSQENRTVDYITREEKASRVAELKTAIANLAVEYPGVLPADAQSRWDADTREQDDLERDIRAWDDRQTRIRTNADNERMTETAPYSPPTVVRTRSIEDIYDVAKIRGETRTRDEYDTKVRENALRSIESQRSAKDLSHLADIVENHDVGTNDDGERASGEIARRILATGSPIYRRAFAKYLQRGNTDSMTAEERAAIAVVGTTTTGGYAVPYIFDPTMYHTGVWTAENPFRKACRTVEITNGNNWRTVTVGAITSAYTTEAAAASENAPAFGQPTYTVLRAQAFATVSIETLEDRPDITSELTTVFAESKDTLEENKFAVGAGTTVPLGMFTDTAYTNQDSATDNVTAIADLQVLEGALPLRYRANAAFFMARSTLRQLMALDTTYRYFSGAGIQFAGQNQPDGNGGGNTGIKCLGYPVWEVPSAVSTLTADGAIIVVLADPKSYIIVDRIGMNVEVVQTMLNGATPSFPTGQRGIYVYWRNYAAPIAADAGRSLSVQ